MVVSALGPHADSQRLGYVSNVLSKNISLDNVTVPVHVYQTNGGHSYVTHPVNTMFYLLFLLMNIFFMC